MCHEKEWRYAKLNIVLKEFDSTQNKIEWPDSEFERGKTALIRTHENEIDCPFAEFDRENLYYELLKIIAMGSFK